MPIYRFRCPECLLEEERVLPIADRDSPIAHTCGATMERLMSAPSLVIFKKTGRGKILDTLNGEPKGVRSKKSQDALARGLDYENPVVGRGFG